MEWINVKDRLPVPNTDILVYHKSSGVFMGRIDDDFITWRLYYSNAGLSKAVDRDNHQINFWMPLPKPTKTFTNESK